MDHNTTFRIARQMGINRLAAARMRIRYLMEEIEAYKELDPWGADPIIDHWLREMWDEVYYLLKDAYREPAAAKNKFTNVTPEDIEQARQYPITRLVEFNRYGKAIAWCHDDKRPSMYHGTKKNMAICPVCNLKFSPIDVLMKRDGYKFYDAVRQLI